MKISTDDIKYIENVVKTGQIVGIDNVIIESGMVRAIDDARTVVLFQDTDVPDMPFGSIGINRIGVFLSRLEIAKTQDNLNIQIVTEEGSEFAKSVTMNSTDTKIDYRCANPTTIQAPKQINDSLVYNIQLNAEAVSLLQKGHTAMGAENVAIKYNDSGVSFEMVDINSDNFIHTFADSIEILDEAVPETFSHNYPVKTLLALFKQNPNGEFKIGTKGILGIIVNSLNIYVLPKV